jgi:beta-lactamase superfamily II metal-dependent hydrolase
MLDLGANASGGGGDAIVLTDSTAGRQVHALIDAGPAGANASNPAFVRQQLQALGIDTLAFLLLTHAHGDHFEGIPAVLTAPHVVRFIHNNQRRTYTAYNNMLAQAQVSADSMIVPTTSRSIRLGTADDAAEVTIVPPLPAYLGILEPGSDSINNGSIGAALELGGFRMFFTGDGEVEANNRWRTQFASLTQNLDVLKVGHHGANDAIFDNGFSGASTWLTHTDPEVSIISANGTTHPRVNALTRLLQQSPDRTYCTNVHGNITLRVARTGAYTVSVQKNPGMDCVPGSQATS